MRLSDLIWATVFVGLGMSIGAMTGGTVGKWCGGIIGFGLLFLICELNLHHFHRVLTSKYGKSLSEKNHTAYGFESSWEGEGTICDEEHKPLWRYKSIGGNIFRSQVYGFFWLPPFAVYDLEGRELLVFKRTWRFPFSVYQVKEGDHVVGRIRKQSLPSLLTTKYSMEFEGGLRCIFWIPRFSVWFHGETDTGGGVLVQMWHHRTWLVALDSNIDKFWLVAAFAFIHRERLRSG